jgi:DNA-binding response OmpR family regulator
MILVVEHDAEVGRPLVDQLDADGYTAQLARTAEHARVLARGSPPTAGVLCDLEHPCGGLRLLAEVREGGDPWPERLPVIVVSTRAQEPDVLRAFDAGADDFMARPASYLELRARLRAVMHRASPEQRHVSVGPLVVDARAHTVSVHGRTVALRRLEYELLLCLARDPGRVFAKDELMRDVWGYPQYIGTRTLDSHASRLRGKLRAAGSERWIINVRGVGYRLI